MCTPDVISHIKEQVKGKLSIKDCKSDDGKFVCYSETTAYCFAQKNNKQLNQGC